MASVTEVVRSEVMALAATCFRVVVAANSVPITPTVAACIVSVISEHPQFAGLSRSYSLKREVKASEASIHHSTRSLH